MKAPLDKNKKAGLAIIGLLPLILAGRGIHTFITGEYHGQPRFGGSIDLTGLDAYMMGAGFICLSLMVGFAMLIELGVDKRLVGTICGLSLAAALISFWLSY